MLYVGHISQLLIIDNYERQKERNCNTEKRW